MTGYPVSAKQGPVPIRVAGGRQSADGLECCLPCRHVYRTCSCLETSQHAALEANNKVYEQITDAMHRPRALVLLLSHAPQATVCLVPLPTV